MGFSSWITCAISWLILLSIVIGLPLFFILITNNPKNPTFAVESTVVKAYNLTTDDRLFCIINLVVRAHNPNPKKHFLELHEISMEVRKGKHHTLAGDVLPAIRLGPGGNAVVGVEAVGLRVGLGRKIVEEVRGDVAAGGGEVNVYLSGYVGSDYLDVTCKNVGVDFSRSKGRVDRRVECGVSVTSPSNDD